MTDTLLHELALLLTAKRTLSVLRASIALAVGALGTFAARRVVAGAATRRLGVAQSATLKRLVTYSLGVLTLAWTLHELGMNLGVVLGAAGVATVALGFAAQTSVSNLISGIFLVGEGAFSIGDVVTIDDATGTVESIDLLSVKLRTLDNRYVRVPNEAMIKSKVTNLTRYPTRRVDIFVPVAHAQSLERVRTLLLEVAARSSHSLADPPPEFTILGFGDTAIDVQISFWCHRDALAEAKSAMHEAIQLAFNSNGVGFPLRLPGRPPAPG